MWDVVKNIENHKLLKKSLVELYKKYVLDEYKSTPKKAGNADGMDDNNKGQREFLEDNVKHIKEQLMKNEKENSNLKRNFMVHNVELLSEINQLTKQKHQKIMEIAILQTKKTEPIG